MAASTSALQLYPFHAAITRETTGRIMFHLHLTRTQTQKGTGAEPGYTSSNRLVQLKYNDLVQSNEAKYVVIHVLISVCMLVRESRKTC
jgi:hypothetical protein